MERIIYNVTSLVDWSIHDAWLQWMLDIHIPEVLGTGCFEKHQLVKLLETDEEQGATYAVQYYAASQALYQEYIDQYAPAFRQLLLEKWGDKVVAFRSLMAIVQ